MGIAEGRGGARGPENVWGSAATGEKKVEENSGLCMSVRNNVDLLEVIPSAGNICVVRFLT